MTTEAPETALVSRPKYWEIADDLQAYAATLEMVDAQIAECTSSDEHGQLLAERAEIEIKIKLLHEASIAKADATAGVLRRMKSDIAAKKAERDRLAKAVRADERALAGLEGYVSRVMESMGKDHLKGALSVIALRGKGGLAPLAVNNWDKDKECWTGKSILPDEFATWEGKFTNYQISAIRAVLIEDGWESEDLDTLFSKFTRVPANTLIRAALAEPCPDCEGTGKDYDTSECDEHTGSREIPCAACGGAKTRGVPGCSLGARGVSLVIK